MTIKAKIIQIICPYCQIKYMIQKRRNIFARPSQEIEWKCLSCSVWVWPESWFNELPQFEHLIKRQRDR